MLHVVPYSQIKILYKQIEAYHTKSFIFQEVTIFWPIQNTKAASSVQLLTSQLCIQIHCMIS